MGRQDSYLVLLRTYTRSSLESGFF